MSHVLLLYVFFCNSWLKIDNKKLSPACKYASSDLHVTPHCRTLTIVNFKSYMYQDVCPETSENIKIQSIHAALVQCNEIYAACSPFDVVLHFFLVREILVCIVTFISRMVCESSCIKVYIRCRYNTRKLADIGCHAVPYQTPVQNTVTSMAFAQHNTTFDLLTKNGGVVVRYLSKA